MEANLEEYLTLADELRIYPGDERRRWQWWLIPLAPLAWIGKAINWPILKVPGWVVRPDNTELHAIGSDRTFWGIMTTVGWYLLLTLLLLGLGIWQWGWWGVPAGFAALVLCGSLGVLASRAYRPANLALRRLVPSGRYRRYRELGLELYTRFEGLRSSTR